MRGTFRGLALLAAVPRLRRPHRTGWLTGRALVVTPACGGDFYCMVNQHRHCYTNKQISVNLLGKFYESGTGLEATSLGNIGRLSIANDHNGPKTLPVQVSDKGG